MAFPVLNAMWSAVHYHQVAPYAEFFQTVPVFLRPPEPAWLGRSLDKQYRRHPGVCQSKWSIVLERLRRPRSRAVQRIQASAPRGILWNARPVVAVERQDRLHLASRT